MPRFMLDTDTCSYIMKRSHPLVLKRLRAAHVDDVCMSVITKAELLYGVEVSPRRAHDATALDASPSSFSFGSRRLAGGATQPHVIRQKRIDSEQRAELAASQPAAAIEGLRPFTVKQGQYLAFIYYYRIRRIYAWQKHFGNLEDALTGRLLVPNL